MSTPHSSQEEVQRASAEKQLPLFADLPLFDARQTSPVPSASPLVKADGNFAATLLGLGSIRGLGLKSLKALAAELEGKLSDVWGMAQDEIEAVLTDAKTPSAKSLASLIHERSEQLQSTGQALCDEMEMAGISVIPYASLPPKLRNIPEDPLYWLFIEGNPDIVTASGPMVAVVGTRTPSEIGRRATERVVQLMVRYPSLTLVSGLAEGIDEVAHQVSLRHNVKNLAFLGHGINHVFPESTKELREKIVLQGGAVATEYLPNDKFQKAFFVRRNRLQAAISDLVIPVEAAEKSGTAHTLNFASEYGRTVIGLQWSGANGILSTISDRGFSVLDIFSDKGLQQLDATLRALAEGHQQTAFAFEQTRRTFLRELSTRHTRPEDFERLLREIGEEYRKAFPTT